MITDPFELARAEVMLAGYSARWYGEPLEVLAVEAEFSGPLKNPETGAASKTFQLGGKLDVIVRDADGRVLAVEHKTSSEDISHGSFYWQRLLLNTQGSTYLVGARQLGFEPHGLMWDVLGKPAIRPSAAPLVDADGIKIVHDASGSRVRTKDGKKWRETASAADGYVLQTRDETVDEFRARLVEVVSKDPDAYFQRGPVVRLVDEEREAAFDAWQIAANIREGRRAQRWPRNPDACVQYAQTCTYFPVCAGQASLDDPTKYAVVDNVHSELSTTQPPTERGFPPDYPHRLPLLTNSEMSTYRACARRHHYRYDLGYRVLEDSSAAQRFGTLVHIGLEHWWLAVKDGAPADECLGRAVEMMRAPPKRGLMKTTPAMPVERRIVL